MGSSAPKLFKDGQHLRNHVRVRHQILPLASQLWHIQRASVAVPRSPPRLGHMSRRLQLPGAAIRLAVVTVRLAVATVRLAVATAGRRRYLLDAQLLQHVAQAGQRRLGPRILDDNLARLVREQLLVLELVWEAVGRVRVLQDAVQVVCRQVWQPLHGETR